MELGMVGLGRMGANMAQRLVQGGHTVSGFDPSPEARQRVAAQGIPRPTRCRRWSPDCPRRAWSG